MSVIFEKYLSQSNSDYVGVYEPSGKADGYTYGYVGNNSSLAGFYLLFKLTSDFPFAGVTVGGAASSADRVETAIFRMAEVNAGTRGSNALTLKISPIFSTWNPSATFASIPGYRSSIVDTYSSFGDAPSSSNYDYRTGYHSATYKLTIYRRLTIGDPWNYYSSESLTQSEYSANYNTWGGVDYYTGSGGYYYWYHLSSTSAYYDTYIVYHNIDITDVIKDCITNGATGLICYFDITNSTYNRKVFETTENTATGRQPKLTISFSDEAASTEPPILIATTAGSIDKQMTAGQIFTTAWKAQTGRQIFDGTSWKDVF